MNQKKPLRAGMIGAGSSAKNIATTIEWMEDVDLVALANRNLDHAKEITKNKELEVLTTDYREVCTHDVDFVIVSLPHGLHHEVCMYALEQGKHVLVEKPIATKLEDAEEMIKLARKKDLRLGVHFQNRLLESVQEAKKLIDSGKLGKILQANVSVMWFRDVDYYQKSSWRGTWELEGGGSLINQAIHTVDQMVYLLGDVKKLFGFWDHKLHDIETEDSTAAAFIFKSGVLGTLQTSTATKAAFPAKLTIFGTEGALEINGDVLTIHEPDGKSRTVQYNTTEGGQVGSEKDPRLFSLAAHSRLMKDFVDAIREGRDPMVSGEEGLRSLRVVLAVYESNGQKVVEL